MSKKWEGRWNRLSEKPVPVGLGCGINTGSSLVGNLGTATREQFTALGPTVNFAARLEALAKSGQILLSKKTAETLEAASSPQAATLMDQVALQGVGYITNIKNIPGKHLVYEVQAKG